MWILLISFRGSDICSFGFILAQCCTSFIWFQVHADSNYMIQWLSCQNSWFFIWRFYGDQRPLHSGKKLSHGFCKFITTSSLHCATEGTFRTAITSGYLLARIQQAYGASCKFGNVIKIVFFKILNFKFYFFIFLYCFDILKIIFKK